MQNIRNFVIIAHIDHGKSTLADRLLEITGTIEARKMKTQYLDQLDLERERGITIKMAPVRMLYDLNHTSYILNLIDTPGHSDFSYEVSRALAAVEGAVLLVDATQGIQAQTLANFRAARETGLTVIGALNKIDLVKHQAVEPLIKEIAALIGQPIEAIHQISGKTGEGVADLLSAIVAHIPPPRTIGLTVNRALIFDSFYDDHKGVVASVRVMDGIINKTDTLELAATRTVSKIKELGYFAPELKTGVALAEGEIGYIATGIKNPGQIKIGDTIIVRRANENPDWEKIALAGYQKVNPVVFVSFYPAESDNFEHLEKALEKLKLNDSALMIEPDQNQVLGRGFKIGFLGKLHFEITAERLRREANIETVNTFPSVKYRVKTAAGWETIIKPEDLPENFLEIWEPVVQIEILLPSRHLNSFFNIQHQFRFSDLITETFQEDRVRVSGRMPLAELISDFDDQLKSVTEGFASFSYEFFDYIKANIQRMDVVVAGEPVAGLSRFFPKATIEKESRQTVERLKEILPREQFAQSLQAIAGGRILAREDIPALRKDVTGYLYGGDRTRKMKLWKKQKRGKEKLKAMAKVNISPEIFRKLLQK